MNLMMNHLKNYYLMNCGVRGMILEQMIGLVQKRQGKMEMKSYYYFVR
jgi:hypothetical protein